MTFEEKIDKLLTEEKLFLDMRASQEFTTCEIVDNNYTYRTVRDVTATRLWRTPTDERQCQ